MLIIGKFIIEEACNFHCKENKNKKTLKILIFYQGIPHQKQPMK
jgi:hypothetical protein